MSDPMPINSMPINPMPINHDAIAKAVAAMAATAVMGGDGDLRSATHNQLLDVISVSCAISQAAESSIQSSVSAARQRDCTWSQIGRALGVSRQAAYQRFGRSSPTNPVRKDLLT